MSKEKQPVPQGPNTGGDNQRGSTKGNTFPTYQNPPAPPPPKPSGDKKSN